MTSRSCAGSAVWRWTAPASSPQDYRSTGHRARSNGAVQALLGYISRSTRRALIASIRDRPEAITDLAAHSVSNRMAIGRQRGERGAGDRYAVNGQWRLRLQRRQFGLDRATSAEVSSVMPGSRVAMAPSASWAAGLRA